MYKRQVTGDGVIDSSESEFGGYGAINNYGALTIENGTFRGSVAANGSGVYVRPGSEAVINGGTFEGSTRAVFNAGKLTVNGGVFNSTSCNQTKDSNGNLVQYAYCVISEGELYFNGGSVTGVQGGLGNANGYGEVRGGEMCIRDSPWIFHFFYCKRYFRSGQWKYQHRIYTSFSKDFHKFSIFAPHLYGIIRILNL